MTPPDRLSGDPEDVVTCRIVRSTLQDLIDTFNNAELRNPEGARFSLQAFEVDGLDTRYELVAQLHFPERQID